MSILDATLAGAYAQATFAAAKNDQRALARRTATTAKSQRPSSLASVMARLSRVFEGKAFKAVLQGGGYHPNTSGTCLLRADETRIARHIGSG